MLGTEGRRDRAVLVPRVLFIITTIPEPAADTSGAVLTRFI